MSAGSLQWGGRFRRGPDPALLAFGSSLEDDLLLAPFDLQTSRAHVRALVGGGAILPETARALDGALDVVAAEIEAGRFAAWAREGGFEDIHGAIDARVREIDAAAGGWLHAGRSRNDQVATTLALYAAARARDGLARVTAIAAALVARARSALAQESVLAGTTHGQPAQPILLAFWLQAAAEPFVRGAQRFASVAGEAMEMMPLGSGALAGSCLPLDRLAAARYLGFAKPSRNALDSVGTRDALFACADAWAKACVPASRISAEVVSWASPLVGYVRIGDASASGSSLMPQKRNPDIFELVRSGTQRVLSDAGTAWSASAAIGLSYHRDLQECKQSAIDAIERADALLAAFERAFADLEFDIVKMERQATLGYTLATDHADALILHGLDARRAHRLVGERVALAEEQGRPFDASDLRALGAAVGAAALDAPLDAPSSVRAKATEGSSAPAAVRHALDALENELADVASAL
ncbi:MAG: argininosuccinate lyase [Candidatus Baltobacteraceae bacterium]